MVRNKKGGMEMTTPTEKTYVGLEAAYTYFNGELFGGRLPRCLLTVRAHRGAYGYFSGERFSTREGDDITDEIALNIRHFKQRSPKPDPVHTGARNGARRAAPLRQTVAWRLSQQTVGGLDGT